MRKLDFKLWELGLISVALLLFTVSVWAYLSDYAFLDFAAREVAGTGESVGKIARKSGGLRRERHGEAEFRSVDVNEPVFDKDTVVTGPDSAASIELEDGSTLDLSASSMIQIRFDNKWTVGGISRQAAVNVVAGEVTGRAKEKAIVIRTGTEVVKVTKNTAQVMKPKPVAIVAPPRPKPSPNLTPRAVPTRLVVPIQSVALLAPSPTPTAVQLPSPKPLPKASPSPSPTPVAPSPSPSPIPAKPKVTRLTLVTPKPGTRFSPEWNVARGAVAPKKDISISWQVMPRNAKVKFLIRTVGADSPEISDVITANNGVGRASWTARRPGDYEVVLQDAETEEKPLRVAGRFTVQKELQHIRILDPLVGGEKASSNQLAGKQLKDFEIKLRWEPIPAIEEYEISIGNAPKEKAVMVREVDKPEFSLSRDKVFSGRIHYSIRAAVENGFVVTSEQGSFIFDFLPPKLTLPRSGAETMPKEGGVLLVWQKTNFTNEYEVQISRTQEFTTVVASSTRTDNFFVAKNLVPGNYYWRVRSLAKNFSSPFSAPASFNLKGIVPVGAVKGADSPVQRDQ